MNDTYKSAGVDVHAGYIAVNLMREHVKKTYTKGVIGDVGGFGGLFSLDLSGIKDPVLVSGTDGVGTKLKLAFVLDRHDTIGIDCVAMCVNDIVCSGAKPLFFLDYIGMGKNFPQKVADIVKGIADGCIMSGCALVGGESAEMPGFYPIDEYDLAGFCVGIVDRGSIIDGSRITAGDVLVGLASSGIHSNGYSLVRKIFHIGNENEKFGEFIGELGCTLGEELIKPTKIYVSSVLNTISKFDIKGISHITGGGFIENIPRMFGENLHAKINLESVRVHPIFKLMQSSAKISTEEMYNTFNMGVGMVMAVSKEISEDVVSHLNAIGETAYIIGEVCDGAGGVELC